MDWLFEYGFGLLIGLLVWLFTLFIAHRVGYAVGKEDKEELRKI
jgi:hypothetical protein